MQKVHQLSLLYEAMAVKIGFVMAKDTFLKNDIFGADFIKCIQLLFHFLFDQDRITARIDSATT